MLRQHLIVICMLLGMTSVTPADELFDLPPLVSDANDADKTFWITDGDTTLPPATSALADVSTDAEPAAVGSGLTMWVDGLESITTSVPDTAGEVAGGHADAETLHRPAPELGGGLELGGFIEFPEEEAPLCWELFESIPTALSWPDERLGKFFAELLHTEHVTLETDLEEEAIGIQPIPTRPNLFIDFNEGFLAPGFLPEGIEMPTGAIWRPSFWVFGQKRTAIQYIDNSRPQDPVAEWANRLDLFGQLNLSGTERFVLGLRPYDEEEITRREFGGYDFNNGRGIDAWNAEFQAFFFEGDFGEIFPRLDPYDSVLLDFGFSVGRQALLAQQGLLINEDMIDAVTVTRNTLNGHGLLNLRMTGVYAWNRVSRSSSLGGQPASRFDPSSKMVALLTESDFYRSTVNADVVYTYGDEQFGDMVAFGVSGIQRIHGYHNTYNTSLHLLASFPTEETTPFAEQGELLFAQTSWTPHHTEDLVYLNAFLAIDQFTSPARGPLTGSPLGQTGILIAHPGLGSTGPPLGVRTNNTAGALVGYQLFFEHTRRQLIWEIGGHKEYEGPENRGALGTILRYQQAYGQHTILVLDGFVGKQEGVNVSSGARAEFLFKF